MQTEIVISGFADNVSLPIDVDGHEQHGPAHGGPLDGDGAPRAAGFRREVHAPLMEAAVLSPQLLDFFRRWSNRSHARRTLARPIERAGARGPRGAPSPRL